MNRRGYTLIEALVVTAMMSILAALTFPLFALARESAHATTCQNNLKQIGTTLSLYADDWEGAYQSGGESQNGNFSPALARYVPKGSPVWICPSSPWAETASVLDPDDHILQSSYFKSSHFFNQGHSAGTLPCVSAEDPDRTLESVKRPASTIMVSEIFERWYPTRINESYLNSSASGYFPVGRFHRNRTNYLFADGHVRLLTLRQTLTPEVLWDNIGDWCPECGCADKERWETASIHASLDQLNQFHQP